MKTKLTRALTVLLSICFLVCLSAPLQASAADNTVHISSAEDLLEFAENCRLDSWSEGKVVRLDGDISLEGTEFTSIPSFSGCFYGDGHTISGLTLSGNMDGAGLFLRVETGGIILNLKVSGSISVGSSCNAAGGIAAYNAGMITGCSFSGSITGSTDVGGIVGYNQTAGSVMGCSTTGAVTGSSATGGIAGYNAGLIAACTNSAYINISSSDTTYSIDDLNLDLTTDITALAATTATPGSSSDTGGIAGYSCGTVSDSANSGMVGYPHVGYNVGGVVGRSSGCLDRCTNSGTVYGRKDVGGIAGQLEPYITAELSESDLAKLQEQMNELSALVDKAASDAEGGTSTVTSRLNSLSSSVKSTVTDTLSSSVSTSLDGVNPGSITTDDGSVTITGPSTGSSVSGENGDGVSVDSNTGSVTIGQTEDGISLDVTTPSTTVTPSVSSLNASLSSISSQISAINSALSGTVGAVAEDMKEITAKYNEISETFNAALESLNDPSTVISDTSTVDPELVTLGKAKSCTNTGEISGDLNVGGIAGSMAEEYELDPEDDLTASVSATEKKSYELRVIIQNCTNRGAVTARRNYAGSICGMQDIGLILRAHGYGNVTSESGSYVGGIAGLASASVEYCDAKCTLSGSRYVGGIAGAGVTETAAGASSTVLGCISIVEIENCSDHFGAVCGEDSGEFSGNVFVSDTLGGIGGISFAGRAESVSYEELLRTENLPDELKQFTLRFLADGTVLKTVTFNYGDSFTEDVYPDIPEKEGFWAAWDRTDLNCLCFDTDVSVVYTQFTTAVSAGVTRENGREIFFAEGAFNDSAVMTAEEETPDTASFSPLDSGIGKALSNYFSENRWYQLPTAALNCSVLEQWKLTVPTDSQTTHTVRYLPESGDPDNIMIYIRENGSWYRAETGTFGSCVTFDVTGAETEIAVVSVTHIWWAWLIAALLVLALFVFLIVRAVKRTKKLIRKISDSTDGAKPKRTGRKHSLLPAFIVLLILLIIGGAAAAILSSTAAQPYLALRKLMLSDELSMQVRVEAKVNENTYSLDASVEKQSEGDTAWTLAELDGVPVYYAGGCVFLENGAGYRIGLTFPNYSTLLDKLLPLFKDADYSTKESGTEKLCTLTVSGSAAKELTAVLMPKEAELLPDTQAVSATVVLDGGTVTGISITAAGQLTDGEYFTMDGEIGSLKNTSDFSVPQAVIDAYAAGTDDLPEIDSSVFELMSAWYRFDRSEETAASLTLKANCGPVVVSTDLQLYARMESGTRLWQITKNNVSLWFGDAGVVGSDGIGLTESENSLADSEKLLETAELLCSVGTLAVETQDSAKVFTAALDEDGVRSLIELIAPDAASLDITPTEGSISVTVSGGAIAEVSVECGGTLKLALLEQNISASAEFCVTDVEVPEFPQAAVEALLK